MDEYVRVFPILDSRVNDDIDGTDGRNHSPLVSGAEWNSICARNGFSDAEIVLPDYKDDFCQETSIMVFTAVDDSKILVETGVEPIIIVDKSYFNQDSASHLLEKHFQQNGYPSCRTISLHEAKTCDNSSSVFFISLLDVDEPGLRDFSKNDFENLQGLLLSGSKLLWVTRTRENKDPPSRGIIDGLSRVSRVEDPTLVFVTVDLESKAESKETNLVHHVFDAVKAKLQNVADHSFEPEYRDMGGVLHIKRIIEDRSLDSEISTRLQAQHLDTVASPGLIDSLQFVEDKCQARPLGANEVEVELRAMGLDFMDLLAALGRLGDNTLMGTECAGVISRVGKEADGAFKIGDCVAVACADTCKTFVRCPSDCAILIPDSMPFTDAAAIPTTFSTAYHSLCEIARMQRRETVLIHSAAGGTGQSAIQIANDLGAEIFATVGSDSKKQFLIKAYQIPEDYIFYSRITSFAKGVLRMTSGRGVDVVLNSLSGECLLASWECIAPYGRFTEIGKKDIQASEKIPMLPFAKNVTFSAVDMAAMSKDRPRYMQKLLKLLMGKAGTRAITPAYPLQIYPVADIQQAFRHLQSGQSTGTLVIEIEKQALLDVKPKVLFEPNCTYVIAGGLGSVGRSISRWMVGARNLILLSRTGLSNKYAKPIKEELGCARIETPGCDITDDLSGKLFRGDAAHQRMYPSRCGVEDPADVIFTRTTFEDWTTGLGPKVQGSWNLHKVLPRNMDFFIFLSSLSGIIGRETQASYSAGNTCMDALAQYRVSLGEKAVAIDLGILEDEGMLAENP
ncbi:Reducing polyketide synthase [Lachnellula willkommii]|uniref:Reducing polyketide synthase n=1 Tax=Lachnellula willkommii TaxID=215461 RepID=A0A559MFE8_9HELO|nr:Reducing polyketide synthase [Lachnellula willkommii]